MALTKATQNVIAPITSTGSTAARTLANRFADVVNVKDFGAVGNGGADDTAAIQAAIDSLGTAGGTVILPTGNYKVSTTLLISKSNINIKGSGSSGFESDPIAGNDGSSYITWAGTSTDDVILIGGQLNTVYNNSLKDFSIISSGNSRNNIRIINAQVFIIENIFSRNALTAGLYIGSQSTDTKPTGFGCIRNCSFYQKFTGSNGNAIWINCNQGGGGTMCEFDHIHCIQDIAPAVKITDMDGLLFTHLMTFSPVATRTSVLIDTLNSQRALGGVFMYPIAVFEANKENEQDVASWTIFCKDVGDLTRVEVKGAGSKSVNLLTHSGIQYTRPAGQVGTEKFSDSMFFINSDITTDILTTRDANWKIINNATIVSGDNALGGQIKISSGTSFGGISAGTFTGGTFNGYLKNQNPMFFTRCIGDINPSGSYAWGFADSASDNPSNGIIMTQTQSDGIDYINCIVKNGGVQTQLTPVQNNFLTNTEFMFYINAETNVCSFFYRDSLTNLPVNKLWNKLGDLSVNGLNVGMTPIFISRNLAGAGNFNLSVYHCLISSDLDRRSYPF
jgi:hypothetical protein